MFMRGFTRLTTFNHSGGADLMRIVPSRLVAFALTVACASGVAADLPDPGSDDAGVAGAYKQANSSYKAAFAEQEKSRVSEADAALLDLEYLVDELNANWNDTSMDDKSNRQMDRLRAIHNVIANGDNQMRYGKSNAQDGFTFAGIGSYRFSAAQYIGGDPAYPGCDHSNAMTQFDKSAGYYREANRRLGNLLPAIEAAIKTANEKIRAHEEQSEGEGEEGGEGEENP